MSLTTMFIGSAALMLVIMSAAAYSRLRESSRVIARLAPALVEAPEFFALMERSGIRSHFLERHGPMLNRKDIQERALTGFIPFSKHNGRPVDSARWLKHKDLLISVDSALTHWDAGRRPKGGAYNFAFDYPIGDGCEKGSTEQLETSIARVIIRRGEVVTAYPVLRPKFDVDITHH